MRFQAALAIATLLAAPVLAEDLDGGETETPKGHIVGEYRFGGTYDVRSAGSASSCQALCDGDTSCRAWSFTAMSTVGASRCELKLTIGRAEVRPGSTSGISSRMFHSTNMARSSYTVLSETAAPARESEVNYVKRVPLGSPPKISFTFANHRAQNVAPIRFEGDPDLLRNLSGSYMRLP